MNRLVLKHKLDEMGVNENDYSLYGSLDWNKIILYENYSNWEVFLLNTGQSPCEHWVLRLGLRINKKQIEKYNLAVSFSFCIFAPEMNKNLYIISGCNGAGKTTASYTVLPEILDCKEFVNADEIARGLSPFT